MDCPGASANISGLNVSGTGSFNADVTYSITETVSASVSETIPPSCLTMSGVTLTCAQLDQALQHAPHAEPGNVPVGALLGQQLLHLHLRPRPQTTTETGTYTTSGTTITTTDSTGTSSSSPYCVQGNELHMLQVDMTMAMGKVQADIVLTKK